VTVIETFKELRILEISLWRYLLKHERQLVLDVVLPPEGGLDVEELLYEDIGRVTLAKVVARVSSEVLKTQMYTIVKLRSAIIQKNLGLAHSVLRRYISQSRYTSDCTYDDFAQEALIGAMTALDRFDPWRGFSFSTYASNWIRHSVLRARDNTVRPLRLPVHVGYSLKLIFDKQAYLTTQLRRKPTLVELSVALGMTEYAVDSMMTNLPKSYSLDSPFVDIDNLDSRYANDLYEYFVAPESKVDHLEITENKAMVRVALTKLPKKERDILKMRFGIDSDQMTLQEIGEKYRVSRERIRQIEVKALPKLKRLMHSMESGYINWSPRRKVINDH